MATITYKFLSWFLGLTLFAFFLIIGVSTEWFSTTNVNIDQLLFELGFAIIIGLISSFLIGFISVKDQFEKQIKVLGVSKEVLKSGFLNFFGDWEDVNLVSHLKDSKEITFYFVYAGTVLGDVSRVLKEKLQQKDVSIKIYLMHEENHFVDALGKLWGKDREAYNAEGIRNKIQDSTELLLSIKKNLEKRGKLKADFEVYKLLYHPVFFSFYIFDKKIIFSPSKNIEKKLFSTPSILCKKTDTKGLYDWCSKQVDEIDEIGDQALEKLI